MKYKILSLTGLVLVVAGVCFLTLRLWARPPAAAPTAGDAVASTQSAPPVAAGDLAADFRLQSLNGKEVALKNLRGKVVFLNVWATWCGPCRDELPSMEKLYQALKSRPDFVMLAVSEDRAGRPVVMPFVEQNNLHFQVLLDPDNQIGDAYNVTGVPETFIIDRNGRIVAHHVGGFDWSRDDIREALNELLNSKES